MRTHMFLLTLTLIACESREMTHHNIVKLDTCQLQEVYSDWELDGLKLERNFRKAQAVMVEGGVFETGADFCEWMKNMHVEIWNANDIDGRLGWYSLFTGIKMTWDMQNLVHEVLHSVNVAHFQPGTINHEGWDEVRDGNKATYNTISERYEIIAQDPRILRQQSNALPPGT